MLRPPCWPTFSVLPVLSISMRGGAAGSKIGVKLGAKWDGRGVGQMGVNLQMVDVIDPCSEGWEGPDVCFQPSLCRLARAVQSPLLEESYV